MSAPVDIRARLGALRRRGGVLVAAALVGLAGGSAWALASPTPLTSSALVLLPTPALAESASSDVATQVRIAQSADVLQRAGDAVAPAVAARKMQEMVKVDAATDQLLEISVTSPDPTRAQKLTQAAAEAYVTYVRDAGQEVTSAALADLTSRRNDLQGQLDALKREVEATTNRQKTDAAGSSAALAESQLLTGLTTQQADVALQLDKVKQTIAAGTPAGSSANGTLVVQQASVPEGPTTLERLGVWAPASSLGALLLMAAILLVTSRNDARVRSRDEIADAVGSPVLASLRSRPQRSVSGWSALQDRYAGPPTESWALRQVLRGLGPGKGQRVPGHLDHPDSLTVVALAGDEHGMALAPQLAGFTSSLGITTRLVPTTGQELAPALWASAAAADREGEAELTVYLAVLDRREPDLGSVPASGATVLAVSSGSATEQELARTAVAIDNAGRAIDGIVVTDPDQADKTSGRHSVAERSSWPSFPTRLTGLAPVADDITGGRS
ncbi:MAG TPA: hypothetical protein VGC37_06775 [Friedmanniella sp.]